MNPINRLQWNILCDMRDGEVLSEDHQIGGIGLRYKTVDALVNRGLIVLKGHRYLLTLAGRKAAKRMDWRFNPFNLKGKSNGKGRS